MQCNCLEERKSHLEKEFKGKDELQIESESTYYGLPDFYQGIYVSYDVSYRQTKVNGQPYKNKTHEKIRFQAKYCPFCGKLIKGGDLND